MLRLLRLAGAFRSRQHDQEIIIDRADPLTRDAAIASSREMLSLCPPGHTDRPMALADLEVHLYSRYKRLGGIDDLNEMIVLVKEILLLHPPGHPDRSIPLFDLALHLSRRYSQVRGIEDLNEAIVLGREALSLRPPGDSDRSASLNNLGFDLFLRYKELWGIDDLDEAIFFAREAFSIHPPGHPDHLMPLHNLARRLWSRYVHLRRVDDLNKAIDFGQAALSLLPPRHSLYSRTLNHLANCLSARFERLGQVDDLGEAINLDRRSLSSFPRGHADSAASLDRLAYHLSLRFKQLRSIDDLNEGITLSDEALLLRPPGHPDRAASLNNRANILASQHKQLGETDNLNQAIALDREALRLRPPGHSDRLESLNNLANHLSSRYDELGEINDLDQAVIYDREALSLLPRGHPDLSLNNLAHHLSSRYKRLGDIDDLNGALELCRNALSSSPPEHGDRRLFFINLARCLSCRYDRFGEIDDLNEALDLSRAALEHYPSGGSDRPGPLNTHATLLFSRFEEFGNIDDLNEAIAVDREALSICSHDHVDYWTSLMRLAADLFSRYRQLRGVNDLDEAIDLDKKVLSILPPEHHDRAAPLNNLAKHLSFRYREFGDIDDLNSAIDHGRVALSFCSGGHPGRLRSLTSLAADLLLKCERLEPACIDDLIAASTLNQEALQLSPPGHHNHSSCLRNLATYHFLWFKQLGDARDIGAAIGHWETILSLRPHGHPARSVPLNNLALLHHARFKELGRTEDKEEMFRLYAQLEDVSQTVSSDDLVIAKAWVNLAEEFSHTTTLSAYETALRLLVEHSVALPALPQHLDLIKYLSSSLAVDAFATCLRNQSPTRAVELLEQGRGVFWRQLTRLRSPLDITSGAEGTALADEFTLLTSLIRTKLQSSDLDQHDRVWQLNLKLNKVLSEIRELPGHSRFLLPLLFTDLQCAARDGPVIIVNASKYGRDALIVFADKDPVHIPLKVTQADVQEFSSRLYTLRHPRDKKERTDMATGYRSLLRDLWGAVVSKIMHVLRETCPPQSRIWWCPTGEFSHLPLHAATPFREGQQGVSDLFISSYTTTLTALIHAKPPSRPNIALGKKRFVTIGQANAPGFKQLASISTELDSIEATVRPVTTFTRIEGEQAGIAGVTDALSKNEWVHLACHGVANQNEPFESAFALRDGMFSIQRIIQCNLENPEFAYLSACFTAVGDEEEPDEVIHLVSAMQFAGFRSIVGTMWSVDDSSAARVASKFYQFMEADQADTGRLDYDRAAWALWRTLRTVDITIDQRILYVHHGA